MQTRMRKPLAVLLSALMLLSVVSVGFVMPVAAQGNADAYSLTYNANGGVGGEVTQTVYNRQATSLIDNPYTKTGYHLTGWNTQADGNGVSYAAGASVTNPAVSYRARYIRVYAAGNTNNDSTGAYMANHLSELQVIDTQGVNVAQGKSGDVVTDGNIATTSGCYYNYGACYGRENYYQLDLGGLYDVKTVNMWRYWEDLRFYHNTVVVLSENGTFAAGDRLVLFNADYQNRYGFGNGIDMEYPESAYGISLNVSDVRRANTYEARYIRIYAAGNDINDRDGAYMANPFVELVVNDINGNNVALNKRSDYGTNGVVDTNQYMVYGDWNGTGNYYQVDFGGVYDIASIGMWRYWADSRTYHDTVIVLSKNGTFAEGDRFIVFNADDTGRFGFGRGSDKDYVETARGKAFYVEYEPENLPTFNARYVRVYAAGNDKNDASGAPMANHIVELKVMAAGDNVALNKSGTAATDGTLDTNSYYYFGSLWGMQNYFQVDFGAVYPVNSVSLWNYWDDARTYHNLIIALSGNGTFAGDDLLVIWNSDNSNMFGFGRGTDPTYVETSAGRTFAVPENGGDLNTVTARYIRVYDYGNDSNDNMGYPRCDQVAEFAAYTKNGVNVASFGSAQDASIIDGNISYGVYYPYGTGYGLPNEYFWVDLGQQYELAKIDLWRYWVDNRTFHSQVIALSRNGTFTGDDLTIIYNTDKNNVHGFGAGTNAAYVETGAGHTFYMPAGNSEPSARARYVRVYSGGSYANDRDGIPYAGIVTELQVFAGSSVNLAYGKTGTVATDGSTNDASYYGYGGPFGRPNYFQVDLGAVYDVTSVKLWQYYSDHRTYRNNVIVLSENGTFAGNDYTVIFNTDYCNMHGFGKGYDNEYVESAAGREFRIRDVYAASSGSKTLYAQWAPNAYTINFEGNAAGVTGSTAPVSATYDADAALTANGFSRFGYSFAGWAETPDGAAVYGNGANVRNLTAENNGSVTLYAKWSADPYRMTFDVNGGDAIDPIDYTVESTDTIPAPNRDGYDFVEWTATAAAGSWNLGNTYAVGATLGGKIGDVTLQASWSVRYDTPYTVNHYYMQADGSYPATPVSQTLMGQTDTAASSAALVMETDHYTFDAAASDASKTILGDGSMELNLYYTLGTNTVLFKNAAGETVQTDTLYYGATPAYTGTAPTLAGTDAETYTFLGWTANASAEPGSDAAYYAAGNLPPVTADVTYYPYFGAAVNSYDITFTVEGVDTVVSFPYGSTPAYNGIPAKAADAANTYAFSGWSPAIVAVTGEAAYAAQFTATPVSYLVRATAGTGSTITDVTGIYNYNDTVDFTVTVAEGYTGTPVVSVNGTPVEAAAANGSAYDYSVTVTGNTEITVADLTKQTFTVKFVVDGAETEKAVAYGDTPAYGSVPAKAATAQYTYAFTGWSPELVPATADAEYTAQFSETLRSYDISFVTPTGTNIISVPYGETPDPGFTPAKAADAENTYEFAGWSPDIEAVTGEAIYTAQFTATPIPATQYLVTTNAGVGSALSLTAGLYDAGTALTFNVTVAEGYDPAGLTVKVNGTALKNPAPVNGVYTYPLTVTEDSAVTVTGLSKYTYAITFIVGTDETEVTVAYGETPDAGFVPVKAADGENYYTFTGWNTAADGRGDPIAPATANASYYAVFTPTAFPAHEHSFDTFVRTVAATCVAGGYDEYICTCGMTEQRNATAIAPANHAKDPITVGARAATETEDGYTGDVICPACGATITEGQVDPHTATPHVHSFDTLVSHADATCAAKAYDIYACSCGETQKAESGEVDPDNHAAAPMTVGQRDATTESYGYTGDVICPACDHVLSVGTVIEKLTVPHVHSFDTLIDSGEATCVAKAYTVYQCACGETERTETGEKNMNNHVGELKLLGAHAATATADGYSGDTYCLACGTMTEEGHVIDKLDPGHTHVYVSEIESAPATCIAKAYTIYQCECGDTKKVETGEKDAANHVGEIKLMGYHAATETADGYTGDKYCLACGNLVEEGHVLEHTGSTTPENPTQPDTPSDNGSSSTDTRIPFLQWLRNFIKKLLALFKIGGGDNPNC